MPEDKPDAVTDQTSAHDPLNGYLPKGWSLEAVKMRQEDPKQVVEEAKESMKIQVQAMLNFQSMGIPVFDYGNNIRQMAYDMGLENAFDFPGYRPIFDLFLPWHRAISFVGVIWRF